MIKITNYGLNDLYKMGLTRSEVEVCSKVLIHSCQQDIADAMFVDIKTVKYHLTSVYKKLKVDRMHGLLLYLYPLSMEWQEPENIVKKVLADEQAKLIPMPFLPRGNSTVS